MATEVVIPAMDTEQDTVRLARWLKAEGDFVRRGERLLEIETDKATMEVESPGFGVLSDIVAYDGDDVPIGQVVALLRTEQEVADALDEGSEPPATDDVFSDLAGSDAAMMEDNAPDMPRVEADPYRVITGRGLRRTGYQASSPISMMLSVDMDAVRRWSDPSLAGADLRTLALLSRSVALLLLKHPRLNAHLVMDEIRQYGVVHLGIGVVLDESLSIPVIRNVEQKDLLAIRAELHDLIGRARAGRLTADEAKGSTFTLLDLGALGIEQATVPLNPPEVAMLTLGAAQDTPVGRDGEIVLRPIMRLTLNADQRAVDTGVAAAFLGDLKQVLENPSLS